MSRLVVGIATAGRREVVGETVRTLLSQSRRPDLVVVCPAQPDDWDESIDLGYPVPITVLLGPRGLPAQRNAILGAVEGFDYIVFFDDDFIPAASYLEQMEVVLNRHPAVIALTGHVVQDGILGPGLSKADADLSLQRDAAKDARGTNETELVPVYNVYGCNMSFRLSAIRASGALFDETLPLYGWLEDVDFSRQISSLGDIAKTQLCRGVHLGSKRGRTPGLKLGYSQIANPLYLMGKGTMNPSRALSQVARNVLSNLAKVWRPEPWVDRKGRLQGNVRAFGDLLSGKISPMKIIEL